MKQLIFFFCIGLLFTSCVQKTYTKTVVFKLRVENKTDSLQIGIRGDDSPLNWDTDQTMNYIEQDSIYQTVVTFKTGYKFTNVKFVANDVFELQNEDNRKVYFSDKDTTIYKALFNKRNL